MCIRIWAGKVPSVRLAETLLCGGDSPGIPRLGAHTTFRSVEACAHLGIV